MPATPTNCPIYTLPKDAKSHQHFAFNLKHLPETAEQLKRKTKAFCAAKN